jgi:hypothetical protein
VDRPLPARSCACVRAAQLAQRRHLSSSGRPAASRPGGILWFRTLLRFDVQNRAAGLSKVACPLAALLSYAAHPRRASVPASGMLTNQRVLLICVAAVSTLLTTGQAWRRCAGCRHTFENKVQSAGSAPRSSFEDRRLSTYSTQTAASSWHSKALLLVPGADDGG